MDGKNFCGIDDLPGITAVQPQIAPGLRSQNLQGIIIAGDDHAAGKITPGGGIVGKYKGFGQLQMQGFRLPDAAILQKTLQNPHTDGGHGLTQRGDADGLRFCQLCQCFLILPQP